MYYVKDKNGNQQEAYTKEEIMAVLQQAIADGSLSGVDAQSAFVSKLKCCVDGGTFKQAFITEAKYNELKANKQLQENTIYNILDDNTLEVITTNIEGLWEAIDELGGDGGIIEQIDKSVSKRKLLFSLDDGVAEYTIGESYVNKTLEILVENKNSSFQLNPVFVKVKIPQNKGNSAPIILNRSIYSYGSTGIFYFTIKYSSGNIIIENNTFYNNSVTKDSYQSHKIVKIYEIDE